MKYKPNALLLAILAGLSLGAANAAPTISRLTPPSALFTYGDATPPYIARFLPGQRFDLDATVKPDAGQTITSVEFKVNGVTVANPNLLVRDANSVFTSFAGGATTDTLTTATVTSTALLAAGMKITGTGIQTGTTVASVTNSTTFELSLPANATGSGLTFSAGNAVAVARRAYSNSKPGVYTFTATATQSDAATVTATGNFEIVSISLPGLKSNNPRVPTPVLGRKAKNIIVCIGDGLGIAHRTAARIVSKGVAQGKSIETLAMDQFPVTGIVTTHSLNSIVTDSSPGSGCYSTGNKANNNANACFPDDTSDTFDNPRVETMGEYFARTSGKALGLVTTSDVFDATPGAWATHTSNRGAGTGIVDQYFDERAQNGLKVILGGGRKWFLPSSTSGSARVNNLDYTLGSDVVAGWGVAAGVNTDSTRDLIADFQGAGYTYTADRTALNAIPANTDKLLGLFAFSNMNVAKDKLDARRNGTAGSVVNDFGFTDQPMLEEMTEKALQVLNKTAAGFCLMVEGASIDKQAHNMDSERWILDTIEFDRAVAKCRAFAATNPDTLVLVVADHECAGINIIGASRVTNASLITRAASGGGIAQLRTPVVGLYEQAGFPVYTSHPDGYPVSMDVDFKMLIGYAANADRNEDWLVNAKPLQDSQQPFIGSAPLNTYPANPLARDTAGAFTITGQVDGTSAAHTASDIPLSAAGRGAHTFSGVMDNTDVFFKSMQVLLGGAPAPVAY